MFEENTIGTNFIGAVVDRETCRRHSADLGEPCWTIELKRNVLSSAICNKRAKRAGFNAPINDKSLRRTGG